MYNYSIQMSTQGRELTQMCTSLIRGGYMVGHTACGGVEATQMCTLHMERWRVYRRAHCVRGVIQMCTAMSSFLIHSS